MIISNVFAKIKGLLFSVIDLLKMTAISTKSGGSEGEKNRKEKYSPPTRVIVRRLPPTMSKEEFEEQISPIPDHDNLRFASMF